MQHVGGCPNYGPSFWDPMIVRHVFFLREFKGVLYVRDSGGAEQSVQGLGVSSFGFRGCLQRFSTKDV